MKGKDNLSDGEKTGTGRKAVERQTELGMIKVDMEYPYPCVPPPGIWEEKDGKLLIITAFLPVSVFPLSDKFSLSFIF